MQLLIEDTDGGAVVEEGIRSAAARQVMRPLVLRGNGRLALAAALDGVQRSGVPCIVEEGSGRAADVATCIDASDEPTDAAEWTIAIWVGERNQHRWLLSPSGELGDGAQPVVLERHSGGHKLVYFGS
jgi:hypothetical protein